MKIIKKNENDEKLLTNKINLKTLKMKKNDEYQKKIYKKRKKKLINDLIKFFD